MEARASVMALSVKATTSKPDNLSLLLWTPHDGKRIVLWSAHVGHSICAPSHCHTCMHTKQLILIFEREA